MLLTYHVLCFCQRGWSSTFVDALEDAKKKKDIAIERICAKHYLHLLRAVQEVHDLKAASASLKAGRFVAVDPNPTYSLVSTNMCPYLSGGCRSGVSAVPGDGDDGQRFVGAAQRVGSVHPGY